MSSKKAKEKKQPAQKTEFDGRIWPNILDFSQRKDDQLTSKANFIFGASSAALIFSVNRISQVGFHNLLTASQIAWLVLAVGMSCSALFSFLMIVPRPHRMSVKDRVKEDVFWYKNILKFYDRDSYHAYLKDLPKDNDRIAQAYANQIYSLTTKVLPYKFALLKLAGWTFLTTMMLFSITLVFSVVLV